MTVQAGYFPLSWHTSFDWEMSMSVISLKEEERGSAKQARPVLSSPHKRARVPSKTTSRLLTVLPPVVLGLILLVSWYSSTASGVVPGYQLPSIPGVWNALWDGLTSGLLLSNAWVTLQESLGGFLIALAIGLPTGYGLARWWPFAATIQPYLAAGQAIPAIVIAPFLVIWLGYGITPTLVVCCLVVFFPMVITTAYGFQSIDRSLMDAARVEGASFWPMLTRIEFPLALPAIMAAIRIGLTLSIVGALVGEFVVAGDQGLGALVEIAKSQYDLAQMFAVVIILALMAMLLYGITRGLTRLTEAIYG
jgi:NitT/TauT family transport system permease protein